MQRLAGPSLRLPALLFAPLRQCYAQGTRKSRNVEKTAMLHAQRVKSEAGFTGMTLTLSNLFRSPRSRKQKKRYRGIASGGRTHGRGHKGQKSRSGPGIGRGFEGGQTPLHMTRPKFGFKSPLKPQLQVVNLDKLQHWIDMGRIDPGQPITLRTLAAAGVRPIRDGVKILGNGASFFTSKIHIEATMLSASAIGRIEALGGIAIAVHYNRLGLRALLKPESILYKKTKLSVSLRDFVEQLIASQDQVSASDGEVQENIPDSARAIKVLTFRRKKDPKSHKRAAKPHIAGVYDPTMPDKGRLDKATLARLLALPEPPAYVDKLKQFLPKFAGPVSSDEIAFYTSDDKRGYLSPHVLEKLGQDVYARMPCAATPTRATYRRLGLEYWIQRGHVVVTRDRREFEAILSGHGFALPATKEALRAVEAERERANAAETAYLTDLGLQLTLDRSAGAKAVVLIEPIPTEPIPGETIPTEQAAQTAA